MKDRNRSSRAVDLYNVYLKPSGRDTGLQLHCHARAASDREKICITVAESTTTRPGGCSCETVQL
jgi:hypothetical protein